MPYVLIHAGPAFSRVVGRYATKAEAQAALDALPLAASESASYTYTRRRPA